MESLITYIKLNGNYIKYAQEYDDELCEYYQESHLSVTFNNKYYFVKIIETEVQSNSVEDLEHKLVLKIIYDLGHNCLKNYFSKNNFTKNNFTILHRGNCKNFMENSLEALKYGIINYDGFETDIRLTKDDHWIINHDSDCNRIHQKNMIIKETNLVDILSKTKIIKLKTLLFTNNYDNKLLNIEIKEPYKTCSIKSKILLVNILLQFKNKLIISSFEWDWYYFIASYNITFCHLILDIDKLPSNYTKLIISKNDYQNIILKGVNLPIYGVYGSTKNFDLVNINIIDL
tara:strand:+ start:6070 stop:6933 length:864 start_codon:yes stop_codon:yes gene_type:complete